MKYLYFPLIILLMLSSSLRSGELEEEIRNKLPKIMGLNNVGTNFTFSIPPAYIEVMGDNFVRVFISSPFITDVTLSVDSKSFSQSKTTKPDEVIAFDIPYHIAFPFLHEGNSQKAPPAKIYKGAAINIEADNPIVAYVVVRIAYSTDGFLLIPNKALGMDYTISAYPEMGWAENGHYPPWTNITALHDNTQISFTMGGGLTPSQSPIEGGDKLSTGETAQMTLNSSDVAVFSVDGHHQDISGSKVSANKPISVVTGHYCVNVPLGNQWCDYIVEMDLPMHSWGKHYAVPVVNERAFNGIVRVYAAEDNTDIYRDGELWYNIPKGGGESGIGYIEDRLWSKPQTPKPAIISSDKPINVVFYNPGIQEDYIEGYKNTVSDPFSMGISPMIQFQNEIIFCTPNVKGGQHFSKNYAEIVFESAGPKTYPPDFEFGEFINGAFIWTPFTQRFPANIYNYPNPIDGKYYAVGTLELPGEGLFSIRGDSKFGVYSHGSGAYDSYGYPTSSAFANIYIDDQIAPDPQFTINKNDGNISGSTRDMPEDDINRSNMADIYLQASSTNYELNWNKSKEEFIPGINSEVDWELNVVDKSKDAYAEITFVDKSGNDTTLTFEYSGISNVNDDFNNSKVIFTDNSIIFNQDFINDYKYFNVFDIDGRQVIYDKINDNTYIHNLKSGVYIFNAIGDNSQINAKFIISK